MFLVLFGNASTSCWYAYKLLRSLKNLSASSGLLGSSVSLFWRFFRSYFLFKFSSYLTVFLKASSAFCFSKLDLKYFSSRDCCSFWNWEKKIKIWFIFGNFSLTCFPRNSLNSWIKTICWESSSQFLNPLILSMDSCFLLITSAYLFSAKRRRS